MCSFPRNQVLYGVSVVNSVIKFKCGDIIYDNEYNHYGVVLSQSITPRGGDIVEYIWNRKDTGNFFCSNC